MNFTGLDCNGDTVEARNAFCLDYCTSYHGQTGYCFDVDYPAVQTCACNDF